MPKKRNPEYIESSYDAVLVELKDDESFDIGQSYEDHAATTIGCKLCGNREFLVGMGNYYTAIKCKNCDYQLCVHSG